MSNIKESIIPRNEFLNETLELADLHFSRYYLGDLRRTFEVLKQGFEELVELSDGTLKIGKVKTNSFSIFISSEEESSYNSVTIYNSLDQSLISVTLSVRDQNGEEVKEKYNVARNEVRDCLSLDPTGPNNFKLNGIDLDKNFYVTVVNAFLENINRRFR
ncbi:hypothetical protein [Exiguobacterium sp. s181]|uniref:hypothetical protein n=1 Tax=Exiguobacterium sp. s181 TaxID=2751288 RepID=UPI001BE86888|nr:hypothetical protein [Exiguobacterium sp. s181]